MKILQHTLIFVLGAIAMFVLFVVIATNVKQHVESTHRQAGKVVASTTKSNYYGCNKRGFMLVEIIRSKRIIVVCGATKQPGDNVSVVLRGLSKYNI